MLSKDQKLAALSLSVEIAKKYAESPADKITPAAVMEDFYQRYVKLCEEILNDK